MKLRTNTLWLSDAWEGLNPPELKRRLFEKMVNLEAAQERFWEKVSVKTENECWDWEGGTTKNGYGVYGITTTRSSHVLLLAHRIAYMISSGGFPLERYICHHCDNRLCCNPTHLFLGDKLMNVQDMVNKNRQAKGEGNGSHILTTQEVREIRKLYARGGTSTYKLGSKYGVSFTTIHAVIQRRSWKHVK